MGKKQITPSMMCADIFALRATVELFERLGIEYLHIDVMDGSFTRNYQIGTDFVKQLRAKTKIPLDIHLMIDRPEDKLDWFDPQPGEYVSIHYESTPHVQRALQRIRDRGAKPMLAVNPATPLSAVEEVLPDIGAVLVMTVNPGFAGQKLVEGTLAKIKRLRGMLDTAGYPGIEIEVDGNVSFENAKRMSEAGAALFVAGSSSVFHAGAAIEENIRLLREAIG